MSGAVIIQTNLLKLIVSLMAMAIYMQKIQDEHQCVL